MGNMQQRETAARVKLIERLGDRIEVLEAALTRIIEWADAYPVAVFPEVDDAYALRAHQVLTAAGMTLDRLSADAMRHVLTGVRRIASNALRTQGDAP